MEYVLLFFRNETFNFNIGNSISVYGIDKNFITIVEDSQFTNCFGKSGASISLFNKPGVLLAKNTTFMFSIDEEKLDRLQTLMTKYENYFGNDLQFLA